MDPNDTNSQLQAWFLFMIQQIIASQGATIPHPSMQHSVGPVMGQHYQHPYQPPPSRSQHSGRHRTEARYPNHCIPRSSGTTSRGWSTNNTGTGSAHTPPPSNASMLDSNLVQARRSRPYDRDRSGPSIRRPRRPRTDLSVYAVPLVEAQINTTAGGSSIPAVVPSPAPSMLPTLAPSAPSTSGPSPSPPAAPTAAPATPTWAWMGIPVTPDEDAATDENTSMREQPDEEEDYHTISSGSDTE